MPDTARVIVCGDDDAAHVWWQLHSLQPAGENRRPAGPAKNLHRRERALDPFTDNELGIRIVFCEADRAATDHAATFALEFLGQVGFAAAIVAQVGHVRAGLLAGYIDHGRKHRRETGAEPVRGMFAKPQDWRSQMNAAGAQIDLDDPFVLDAAVIDFTGVRDTFGPMSSKAVVFGYKDIAAVDVVEQTVFDERQHELIKFATTETESQQLSVFAVA